MEKEQIDTYYAHVQKNNDSDPQSSADGERNISHRTTLYTLLLFYTLPQSKTGGRPN